MSLREVDKNHGIPNGPIAKKLLKMSRRTYQQQNSNLRAESSIDFKPIALATQAHQHLLEKTMFNFINYVKVKWSI